MKRSLQEVETFKYEEGWDWFTGEVRWLGWGGGVLFSQQHVRAVNQRPLSAMSLPRFSSLPWQSLVACVKVLFNTAEIIDYVRIDSVQCKSMHAVLLALYCSDPRVGPVSKIINMPLHAVTDFPQCLISAGGTETRAAFWLVIGIYLIVYNCTSLFPRRRSAGRLLMVHCKESQGCFKTVDGYSNLSVESASKCQLVDESQAESIDAVCLLYERNERKSSIKTNFDEISKKLVVWQIVLYVIPRFLRTVRLSLRVFGHFLEFLNARFSFARALDKVNDLLRPLPVPPIGAGNLMFSSPFICLFVCLWTA